MKIIGIDIAKRKFDVALVTDGKKQKSHAFENTVAGHQKLLNWMMAQGCVLADTRVCMEATSQYYEAVANVLHAAGYAVSVVNPLQIKAFGESRLRRQKTDRADAELIARFCEQQNPVRWQPPTVEVKELQRLLARLEALQQMRGQELNRQHESVGDTLKSVMRVLSTLDEEIKQIESQIRGHIDQNPTLKEQHALLVSIPGVGDRVSAYCLAWLQTERFSDPRQAVAYAGLSPSHRQSGTSVHGKSRVSKVGNARLRKILYMPAMSAIRYNAAAEALATRLKAAHKPGKVVIVAIMRKLIHWMYGVLKSKQPFDAKLALAKL